ncbi:MAG TPA: UDP-N-acetylmuramoyl-L-alanine--D-glutamate ligase [Pseudonocardia sp.]|uniref:UDP-N-acetylmuramoyl-L-alanine--D-glutamate ligase n=1 Tax=Pseudonocardia sp. TaxID=60912 RepID=UPI002B6CD9C4|nr:UDP-N-acetylmuramoyl-L-alanine--D-glutamate ligase [Pseudonocardia sp.]HTF53044.1 UDP-N-acetylmuramoyl-L-alanine--D-glutamate ligase [Pseudonocardia sp.]
MSSDRTALTALRGRPVLVAGAGISGLASAVALAELGAQVTVADEAADRLVALPDGVRGELGLTEPPPGTALVVTSPGWRPDAPLLVAAARAGIEVIGEPELAWRWTSPGGPGAGGPAVRWLGVTGTNGKTTTVGMLEAVLRAAGRDAVACGNVGTPVIDAVRGAGGERSEAAGTGPRELAVELSSFQLYWSPSLRPAAGCLLNIAEDHLDWHGGMVDYLAAKARVLTGAVAVAGVDDPLVADTLAASPAPRRVGLTMGAPAPGQLGVLDGTLVDRAFGGAEPLELAEAAEIRPAGPPGVLDALAAAALARVAGVTPDQVRAGLREFAPAPHRGGVIGEVGGVRFVNDSKATNPHAAAAALAGHPRVVWIAGGLLKGASVTELISQHAHRLVGVVLLGTDRAMFRDALLRHAPNVPITEVPPGHDSPMTDAVRTAAAMAAPGDVVLLAPAAASFDQFAGYADRGRAFEAAVATLPAVAR